MRSRNNVTARAHVTCVCVCFLLTFIIKKRAYLSWCFSRPNIEVYRDSEAALMWRCQEVILTPPKGHQQRCLYNFSGELLPVDVDGVGGEPLRQQIKCNCRLLSIAET